jgi:hypothetical protein
MHWESVSYYIRHVAFWLSSRFSFSIELHGALGVIKYMPAWTALRDCYYAVYVIVEGATLLRGNGMKMK